LEKGVFTIKTPRRQRGKPRWGRDEAAGGKGQFHSKISSTRIDKGIGMRGISGGREEAKDGEL